VDQQDYKRIFDRLGDALVLIGRAPNDSLRVLDVNLAWERLYRRSKSDCLGLPIEKLVDEALAPQLANACAQCLSDRSIVTINVPASLADNGATHEWQLSPLDEVDGANRIALRARDISKQVSKVSELTNLRNILEQAPDYIAHFDRDGRALYFNGALLRLRNFTPADIVGRTPTELWSDTPHAATYQNGIRAALTTGQQQELELLVERSATIRWIQVRFTPSRNAAGEVASVICVGRDLTAIKLVEDKLRKSEQQFRTLAENSPDCIMRFDREQRLIYANPTLERASGIPYERFAGKTAGEMRAGPPVPDTEGAAAPMHDALTQALRDGQPLQVELRERDPLYSGGIVYSNFIFVPERGASGEVESVLAIGRDITQLKAVEADLRLLNATLEERVAARTSELELANRDLKGFAYTVSHDLRAPLRAIIGFVALITQEERNRLTDEGRNLLDRISAAAGKLNRLIEDILHYSRAGQTALSNRQVALDQLAQEITVELQAQYPNTRIRIGQLPQVNGDPTMLRQVVQNLLGNALKFSAQRTQPEVEFNWQEQNGQIVFFVRDNGAGFDMRNAHLLGTMFQRLHSDREFPGNGVGLAIVQRLVERHGGRLWATSELNAGATFFFTLSKPVSDVLATIEQ